MRIDFISAKSNRQAVTHIRQKLLPALPDTFSSEPTNTVVPGIYHQLAYRRPMRFGSTYANGLDILNKINEASTTSYSQVPESMNFQEFLDHVMENPLRYLPQAPGYIHSGLTSQGSSTKWIMGEEIPVYDFVTPDEKEFNNPSNHLVKRPTALYGKEKTVHRIVQKIKLFSNDADPDRILLIVGPKGTGKTTLVQDIIFKSLDQFSNTPEGALYTVRVSFPNLSRMSDSRNKFPVGFRRSANEKDDSTKPPIDKLSAFSPEEVEYEVESPLHINPFLLLPKQVRVNVIKQLKQSGKIPANANMDYYLKADVDSTLQPILEELRAYYKGDTNQMYKHIQVRRWRYSSQRNEGLAMVAPGTTAAESQRITHKDDLAHIPAFLRAKGIRYLSGPLVAANMGILYIDDVGRTASDQHGGLTGLKQVDGGNFTIGNGSDSVHEQMSVLIIGTANREQIANIGNLDTLHRRIEIIPAPHVLQYLEEAKIYRPILLQSGRTTTPDFLNAFALWTTMTRLKPISIAHPIYAPLEKDRDMFKATNSALRKAMLYEGLNPYEYEDTGNLNDMGHSRWDSLFDAKHLSKLRNATHLLSKEHDYGETENVFRDFEGSSGCDPLEAEDLIKQMVYRTGKHTLTLLDVLTYLTEKSKTGFKFAMEGSAEEPKPTKEINFNQSSEIESNISNNTTISVDVDDIDKGKIEPLIPRLDKAAQHKWAAIQKGHKTRPIREQEKNVFWNEHAVKLSQLFYELNGDLPLKTSAKHKYDQRRSSSNKPKINTAPSSRASEQPVISNVYAHPMPLLKEVENHYRRKLVSDLRTALGSYQADEIYAKNFELYRQNVLAMVLSKDVPVEFRTNQNKSKVAPDYDFIKEEEKIFKPSSVEADQYRYDVATKHAEWDVNKGLVENIKQLYPNEFRRLKNMDGRKNQPYLDDFVDLFKRQGIDWYTNQHDIDWTEMLPKDKRVMQRCISAMDKLTSDKNYPTESVKEMLDWALTDPEKSITSGTFIRHEREE